MDQDLLVCLTANSSDDFVEKAIAASSHCNSKHPCCWENLRHSVQLHAEKLYEDESAMIEWDLFLRSVVVNPRT